jgi:hypothetical protein
MMELTEEDRRVCRLTGVSLADFVAMKRKLAAEGRLYPVGSPATSPDAGLTQEEREVCALTGVAPADFLAEKQRLAAEGRL